LLNLLEVFELLVVCVFDMQQRLSDIKQAVVLILIRVFEKLIVLGIV